MVENQKATPGAILMGEASNAVEASRPRELPSNERLEGELWSFLRSTLSQGKDIHLDHINKGYEEYSARLDEAARERADALLKLLADFPPTPEPRDG